MGASLSEAYASIADVARLGSGIALVGRRQELSTLEAALSEARAGQAGAVLMAGDAGVGKSRLLAELVDRAQGAGDLVLIGRCLDTTEAALPYLPFAETVRQLADQDEELISRHDALLRLLPDWQGQAEPARTDRDLGQLQLFDAMHSAITDLSSDRTTVLAIEDLHWADRSSRDMLAFLLSRLSSQRLLVIGTYRSDDLHRRHPLRPLLAELTRLPAVERLQLEPLTPAETEMFVRNLADASVSDEVIRSVGERSEGNPFMAEELLSAYSERVPRELAEILLSRLERLSPESQHLLRLASVIGRRFGHDRLVAASGLDEDALDAALREAVLHNVLLTEESGQSYAFRHALLREAIYTDLLPGERARKHAMVARALTGDERPGVAAELAHHSMESHDLTGALGASVRAAFEADELDAPAEMLIHTERALQLWHAVDDPDRVSSDALKGLDPDGMTELRLTRWAAYAAGASGEPDRAIAHGRSAIDLADAVGDKLEAADLRRRYVRYLFTLTGTVEQAYQIAQEAWELVADREPSAVKAWVQAMLAYASIGLELFDDAVELADAAIETARKVQGDPGALAAQADALITRTNCVERREGQLDAARARFDEAIALAEQSEMYGVELRARYISGMTWLESGDLASALATFDAAVSRAASTGQTWSAYGLELRVVQVICRFMAGDWDGAEAAAELAGEAVSGTVATRVSAAGLLVAVGRGRYDVAERRLSHLREHWQADTQVMILLGVCGADLEIYRGRPEEAAKWAEQAVHWLRQFEPWHFGALSLCALGVAAYADMAEAARRRGDERSLQQALDAGDALAAVAADTMVKGIPSNAEVGPEGRAWMLRAEAEASRMHGALDRSAWRAVVDAFGYGETYRQAQARWRYAGVLLGSGDRDDRDEAAEQLQLAAEVADQLGAVPLRDAVSALARRARIGLDGIGTEASQLLTPREHAVLALVASGRTNRQIGAELFISEKTVSVHVSRVMAKLGAASRTEAVSTAYSRGLLSPPR
jgi:DNA-binding CsgD family transcriptional regulator